MGGYDPLVAVVGKPSAGKSSFLNAMTDAKAKTGNFPFTTIKPNTGVSYIPIDCPCRRFGLSASCQPRYGRCENGTRYIPIRMLDVAGLVPGASRGEGLGNQFLDDLRAADALIHVVDVSGTTDESGKETIGYDPINDIDWLQSEIHSWVFNNLKKRWDMIVRRHTATKASLAETFQAQFSGYGANLSIINRFLDTVTNAAALECWTDEDIADCVRKFLKHRFPTVIALNKIDLPDSDKNIARLSEKYKGDMVLVSALGEVFLKKLQTQGFVHYLEGTDTVDLVEDLPKDSTIKLKALDEKTRSRLEKVQDLVLFRYGSTGVQQCVKMAVESLGLIPMFPVKSIHNFTSSALGKSGGVFRDCFLIKPGTSVKQFAAMVHPDLEKHYHSAETVGGRQLAEEDILTKETNIIAYKETQEG